MKPSCFIRVINITEQWIQNKCIIAFLVSYIILTDWRKKAQIFKVKIYENPSVARNKSLTKLRLVALLKKKKTMDR